MEEKERILTVIDESHDQERHKTALHIVHEVAIAHPLFSLATNFPLLAFSITSRDQRRSCLAEMIDEILNDGTRLGQNERLGGTGGLDGDDRRLAQRVDLL